METKCIKEGPAQSPGITRGCVASIKCLTVCLGAHSLIQGRRFILRFVFLGTNAFSPQVDSDRVSG